MNKIHSALLTVLMAGLGCHNGSAQTYQSAALNENNIDIILSQMTLEEKASLVVGTGWGSMVGMGVISSEPIKVPGAAGTTRAVKRLGIPSIVMSDGPAGVRINASRKGTKDTFYCTGFPVGTLLACSWNEELVQKVGEAMGNEALEYGVDVILAPGMNLHRNPLCGRNFEYYSEDPLLTGKIAAAMIRGIQSNGVGTSAKHFAANSQETNRNQNDARVSERTLRELYLKGFEIAVKESSPWTIMSSYNRLNGVFTQEDPWLLTKVLREDWGFDGLVVTDWTQKRNTAAQIAAGNDLMQPGFRSQIKELTRKIKKGQLSEEALDICVRRVLELIVKTPTFKGYNYSNHPDLQAHAAVAREAASEGMVLLENRGALPLSGIRSAAVYGVTSYDVIAGGTGSGNVNKPYVTSIPQGLRNAGISVDEATEKLYTAYTSSKKNRKKGFVIVGENSWAEMPVERSVIASGAQSNDMAILTIGRQAGEGQDRAIEDDFELSATEKELLENICSEYHKLGKKVVVLLNIGGVIETASWKNTPDAVLVVWGPGIEAGNSIADILTGKVNPSGRLSMTFPARYEDHPSSANFPAGEKASASDFISSMTSSQKNSGRKNIDYTEYEEGLAVGYRHFQSAGIQVSYPFGYGLSYTSFSFTEPVVSITAKGRITVSVSVTNTGSVPGKEVVQLYSSSPRPVSIDPERELRAFAKTILLRPGESQTIRFNLSKEDLAHFNESTSSWETASGNYIFRIGTSVKDIKGEASLEI